MAKGVFTTKVTPSYKDVPEDRYHFPRAYLDRVEQTLGDTIIYYEPRRISSDLSSRGGRQSYFAMAQPVAIWEDTELADHFYCSIKNYLGFVQPVRFEHSGEYFESALQKEDGSTNRGAFGHSVRLLPDEEFTAILAAGFPTGSLDLDVPENVLPEVGEGIALTTDRPLIEQTTTRPFRDRAFKRSVRDAYGNRCAITGLTLIDNKGRPEIQAAHIRSVADNGTDSVRNGLALTATVHWLFDHGLVSVADDMTILKAKGYIPPPLESLFNSNGRINLPTSSADWPHHAFLEHHRKNCFVG